MAPTANSVAKGSKKKLKSVTKLKRSAEYRAKRSRTGDEYNIATATKEESKALKKAKAEASLPHKQEKKRQRLLKRSQKLEIQGNKLLAEAKKVAEQYKLMTQAKKLADVQKNDDDNASTSEENVESPSTGSSSSDSEGGVPITHVTPASDAKETKKRRREGDAATSKKENPVVEGGSKSKKSKIVTPEESSDSDDTSDSGTSDSGTSDSESESESEGEKVMKKAKKHEKPEKKSKKNKVKKGKKTQGEKQSVAAEDNSAEQWNVGGLEGGSARQSKFMRLLGAKKGGTSLGATTNIKSDSVKAEADIQRQFEDGMKSKNDGTSKRRGLGA